MYRCLRDCFVGDRYFYAGREYNLPDAIEKSPKNFLKIEEAHMVIEIFECAVCKKTFGSRIALAGHKRSHKE